ncbi:MAG: phage tail sheath protein [Gemmatimonadales bacterium]|nr:MAG: phage tail sheath protein [Gemmatimonadales bacterium]
MPEYLAPGVYVEEVPSGNKPIEGVSTSTAGVVGVTQRGPVGSPVLVTSFGEFTRVFGGLLDHRVFTDGLDALPYAARGFFGNGGQRLYVSRIVGGDAQRASVDLLATPPTGAADTALSARGSEGDTLLSLDDGTDVGVGDILLILDEQRSEYVTVESGPVSSGLRLGGRLRGVVADGTTVTPLAVTEDADLTAEITGAMTAGGGLALSGAAVAALSAGDVLRIRSTSAPEQVEFVEIAADASDAISETGLLFSHPQATTEVHRVTLTPGTATTADAEAPSGSVLLGLASTDDFAAGSAAGVDGSGVYAVAAVVSQVTLVTDTPLTENHAAGTRILRQVPLFRLHARYEGLWGNTLRARARRSSLLETTVVGGPYAAGAPLVGLGAVFGLGPGSVLEFSRDGSLVTRARVSGVDRASNQAAVTGLDAQVEAGDTVRSLEFDLIVDRVEGGRAADTEAFEFLGVDPEHTRYAPRIVGSFDRARERGSNSGEAELIRLSDLTIGDDGEPVADAAPRRTVRPFQGVSMFMAGGRDDLGSIDDNTFVGVDADDPDARTGIHSLRNEEGISIVAVPGRTSVTVQNALLDHCELMRYRFAVVEPPAGSGIRDARTHRQNFDTTRGATYYPWLVVADEFGERGDLLKIPPSGHVMGIYARTDTERGVWKAPANEVVRGILQFETTLTKGEQDILNPVHVNCFRDFRTANRGLRLWGARTLSSDPEWKYVNVRRLFLFLEKSIENGMQFAVFEPNTEALWSTVKRSISNFLITVWRAGGLEGVLEEEAFFVNVGYGLTMTQADIDNGRLIVEVGVAPVKPAEFVIIRISQKTREAAD